MSNFQIPTIPLLGQPLRTLTTRDPQAWAEAVCVSTPVRICEPLQGGKPFHIASAVLSLDDVILVSTEGSAITLKTDQHHSAQLLLPYQGLGSWRIERDLFENLVGDSILYLPQAPLMLDNDRTSGVALNFNPAVLIRTALTMAGPEGLSAQRLAVFGQPCKFHLADSVVGNLIHSLYSLLQSVDQLSTTEPLVVDRLRLDDVLIRMTVLLRIPELLHDQSQKAPPITAVAARRRLQSLLDWIDANLSCALTLSDLEAQAQMSRRNLQYTFRRAYECSPMQWVRRRRLDLAMQRLKQSDQTEGVTTISRELGFMSPAQFSRDFRREFGCTPSSIRRKR